jgi:glycosyltransferase involved in cell wall biosynthesis
MADSSHITKRIGIDCRLAGKKHAGIGRYVENLITRLPQLATQLQWVYFFYDQAQMKEIFPAGKPDNVESVFAPVRHYSTKEQLKMPGIFNGAHLDLLHIPHFNIPLFYRKKTMITIHDLLWHEYQGVQVTTLPSWQYWLKHQAYKFTVAQAVKRAVKILVPAQTIKNIVTHYYPKAESKVVVTKEGIEPHFLQLQPSHRVSKLSLKNLVYVGSLYPHKNIRIVIDALQKLPGYTLQIVGSRNVFQHQVKEYVKLKGVQKQVEFLGYVPDDQLLELYQRAFALVQPSFSEGFGLTGVEAMAAGVPVIASNIPIFHEIYQDAVQYFDPYSWESFISAVQKLEKTSRSQLIHSAREVVAQYDWQKMAEQTLDTYLELL